MTLQLPDNIKPILEPQFWKERLQEAQEKGQLWRTVFHCNKETWDKIEQRHREILAQHIKPTDSILDAGCGYGRLLTILPREWKGAYMGVDLSPDLIRLAIERTYPPRLFMCKDLREISKLCHPTKFLRYDWAILISIRPMVIGNLGQEEWNKMEAEIRKLSSKLLYLEYDINDKGVIA